jgi:hypothetical protein
MMRIRDEEIRMMRMTRMQTKMRRIRMMRCMSMMRRVSGTQQDQGSQQDLRRNKIKRSDKNAYKYGVLVLVGHCLW